MKHEDIVAWVEAHRDTLPTTLAELSAFPVPFRKVIVNSVSPRRERRSGGASDELYWC